MSTKTKMISEWADIVDYIPAGIAIIGSELTVVAWNRHLEQWTGISRRETVGKSLAALFPHLDQQMYRCRIAHVVMGGPPAIFSPPLHAHFFPPAPGSTGAACQQAIVASLPGGDPEMRHALICVEDVTDLVEGTRNLRRMRDQALAKVARSERAEIALRQIQDELEQRVRQRTVALVRMNESLQAEIQARSQAQRSLSQSTEEMRRLLSVLSSILVSVDARDRVVQWNPAAEAAFGIPAAEAVGKVFPNCGIGWDWQEVLPRIEAARALSEPTRFDDVTYIRGDGSEGVIGVTLHPLVNPKPPNGLLLLASDVTRQRAMEAQLAQAQKLEAMGQLAAGIAHEVNTPTQYIGDNIQFLAQAWRQVGRVLEGCERLIASHDTEETLSPAVTELASLCGQADLAFLREEIPQATAQSLDGVEHVTRIVRAMKEFSHPHRDRKTPVDLNQVIQSAITLSRNEWKYVAEMETDLAGQLPRVPCCLGDVNQVVLNMIINAAHAIQARQGTAPNGKGRIRIVTRTAEGYAEIEISDTGCGISESIRPRIFDLFFTTKESGHGTGQGLAIARAVVVEKHGGSIDLRTELGQGTTFVIRLPLTPSQAGAERPPTRPGEMKRDDV